MAVSGMTLTRRLFQWRLFLTLAVMAGLVLWFIVHRTLRFTSFDAATYADYFWPRRFGLVPHITGGMVAILVGLAQLWLGMTGHTGVQNDAVFKRHQQGIPARSQQAIFSRVI
jgi:hypothetical protein